MPQAIDVSDCLDDAHVLFGHSVEDREIGVVVAHGSLSLAECVNDVTTDLSTVLNRIAGCWCQISPDAGYGPNDAK